MNFLIISPNGRNCFAIKIILFALTLLTFSFAQAEMDSTPENVERAFEDWMAPAVPISCRDSDGKVIKTYKDECQPELLTEEQYVLIKYLNLPLECDKDYTDVFFGDYDVQVIFNCKYMKDGKTIATVNQTQLCTANGLSEDNLFLTLVHKHLEPNRAGIMECLHSKTPVNYKTLFIPSKNVNGQSDSNGLAK
jgi:hypothetical protein